jgi:hypothetical protein
MADSLLENLLQSSPPSNSQEEAFQYQLELMKIELELVDNSIERSSTITQNVKNFAVITWAASITAFVGQPDLRKYTIFTAILPLLFWFMDVYWTRLRIGYLIRMRRIRDFANSENLIKSFQQRKLVDFIVLDISGSQYKNSLEYKKYRRFWRIMRYGEMIFLYGGLILASLTIGVIALLFF